MRKNAWAKAGPRQTKANAGMSRVEDHLNEIIELH